MQYRLVVAELVEVGAIKVEMDSYEEAWLLRNQVNSELRRVGIKEQYTSSVVGSTLVAWEVEMFGKKGSRHLVMEALGATNITSKLKVVEGEKERPDTDKVFEEVREERVLDIIDKIGKRE